MSVSSSSHHSWCRKASCNNIYLFKKYFIAMGLLTSTDPLVLCYTRAMGPPRPSLLCDHCNDEIITMNCLPIAIVD
jgi:hypothetical protein